MKTNNIYEEQDAIRKLSTDELRQYAQTGSGMTGILSAMELSRRAQMNRAAAGAAVAARVRGGGASVLAELSRDAARVAPALPMAPGYNSGGIVQYMNDGGRVGPDWYGYDSPFSAFKRWLDSTAVGQSMRDRERELQTSDVTPSPEDDVILNSIQSPMTEMQRRRYFQYDPEDRQGFAEWATGKPLRSLGTEDPTTGAKEYGALFTREMKDGEYVGDYYANVPPSYGQVSKPAGPKTTDPVVEDEVVDIKDVIDPLALVYDEGPVSAAGDETVGAPSSDVNRDRWSRGVALLQAASRIANGNGNDLGNLAAGLAEGGSSYAEAMRQAATEQYRNQTLAEQRLARTSRENISREGLRSQRAIAEYQTRAEAAQQDNYLEYMKSKDDKQFLSSVNKTYQDQIEANAKYVSDIAQGLVQFQLPLVPDKSRQMTPEEYLAFLNRKAKFDMMTVMRQAGVSDKSASLE